MNKKQKADISMFTLVGLFFTKHLAFLMAYLPLAEEITNFNTMQTTLKEDLEAQGLGIEGVADSKEVLRQNMSDLIFPMAMAGAAWALKKGELVLIALFDINETSFLGAEQDVVVMCNNIVAALKPIITELAKYGITQVELDAGTASILLFKKAIGTPEQKNQEHQTATMNVEDDIAATEAILVITDKLMISGFSKSKDLLEQYHLSRRVGKSVGQHTAIKSYVYADEAHTIPVANASMEIKSLNRKETTNQLGEGEIVQFHAGTYSMMMKALGFGDQEVPFTVKLGKHVSKYIVMVPNTLDVYVTDSKGQPAAFAAVSIVGTNISGVTDAYGYLCLTIVPEGNGTVEGSDENGNSASKTYVMGNGKKLRIELVLG